MASSVLAKLAVQISADSAQFKKELKSTSSSLKTLESGFKSLAKLTGGLFAINTLKNIGSDVIDITAKFQKFGAVLTNALGSRSQAQDALSDINKFAAKTPFQVDELTSSFVKLVNQGFKPTIAQMTSLGDLAAAQGKSFDQLTEAIIDAQTGEFERLKEFGIRASKEGDKVSFTFKGVKKQVDFTAESIREYILGLGSASGVTGSMAAISGTLGGKISNLQDNFDQIGAAIGDRSSGVIGGMLDLANNVLGSLNDALNDQVGTLQKEQNELNVLVDAITDTNISEEVRRDLINELNQKYPDFLKNLDAEKVTNEQLVSRMKDVNAQFERKILLVSAEKSLEKVREGIINAIDREAEARKLLNDSQRKQAEDERNQLTNRGALTTKTGLDIIRAENEIKLANEERSKLQQELTDRIRQYNEALGLFNATNNDYFTTTQKSTEAVKELSKAELKRIEQLKNFLSEHTGFKIPEVDHEALKSAIDNLGIISVPIEFEIDPESTETLDAEADAIVQRWAANAELLTSSINQIGSAFESAASGQQSFAQALTSITFDIIDMYLKQALAAAIAKSIADPTKPFPVGLAIAGASIGIVKALFSRAVGRSGGSGGGASSSVRDSRPSATGNRQDSAMKVVLDGEVQLKGQDIYLSLKKYEEQRRVTRG